MEHFAVTEWYFLAFMGVMLPYAALRTRQRAHAARALREAERTGISTSALVARGAKPMPSLVQVFAGTLFWLLFTGALAWWTARGWDFAWLVAPRPLSARTLGYGVAAFVITLLAIPVHRSVRTPEELRRMMVLELAPRTTAEKLMFTLVAVAAGVCEELAWRGTFWSLLSLLVGLWPAAVVCVALFAVAHAMQGWKSMIFISGIALLMHLLVYLTGTLVIAMAVHALYDIVAGALIARRAKAFDAERDALAGERATRA